MSHNEDMEIKRPTSQFPTAPKGRMRRYTIDIPGDPDAGACPVYSTQAVGARISVGRPSQEDRYFTADTTVNGRTFRRFARTRDAAVSAVEHDVAIWRWLREEMTEAEAEAWLRA